MNLPSLKIDNEEVKVTPVKKNSILPKMISVVQFPSMNEGAENFQTERMVEEDESENIR